VHSGNHLLVQLKDNQPSLAARLREHCRTHPAQEQHRSYELGQRARIERRTTDVRPLAPGSGTEPWHDRFRTLIQVQRHTDVFDTRRKDWVERRETAYYLSTDTLSAEQAARAIRAHWGIENRLHYVRDVSLGEDASRIRRNPGIFAILRSFALNLLRFNGITNISLGLYDNALDFDHLLSYQGL
jgi:predicted transposase YbfD/YdcC